MKIYTASDQCYAMNHNIRADNSQPEWRVIRYMARVHQATKEQIMESTGVDASVITKLAQRQILLAG